MDATNVTTIGALATAAAACAAAIFSLLTVRATLRIAQATHDVAAGEALVELLNAYRELQKSREQTVEAGDLASGHSYYRRYFDLLWTEFQLWRRGLVPNGIMLRWMLSAHRSYRDGSLELSQGGGEAALLPHKEAWRQALQDQYFDQGDDYVIFMEEHVYRQPAVDVPELRRRFQVRQGE